VAASRSAARFSVITRNLDLRLDVLEALEVLMKAASPKLEVLPGRFLLSLLTKATLVKQRSSFLKEHQTLLFSRYACLPYHAPGSGADAQFSVPGTSLTLVHTIRLACGWSSSSKSFAPDPTRCDLY
jgi:hypothetical protein